MNKKWKKILILFFIVVCIVAFVTMIKKPSIKEYQQEFGFSLEGIDVEIIDFYHESAFQDPWSAYLVRVSGETEGTIFDTSIMLTEPTMSLGNAVRLANTDTHEKDRFFLSEIDDRDGCLYRTLVHTGNSNETSYLHIIYDPEVANYYLLYSRI